MLSFKICLADHNEICIIRDSYIVVTRAKFCCDG